ncbi:MAG TPA: bacillithiol system redox-active protein YtxJ [Flavobacterium sp.]|nr:bacillithiol system redox-active protein YtxJ [Flavobacterium sp.]
MGFFDGVFKNKPQQNNANTSKYKELKSLEELNDIDEISFSKSVVIFKHSTRCSISRFALKRFESDFDFDEEKIQWYLLDLLNHREISNEIAHRYQVVHQSPQIVVIKNRKAVFVATHEDIDADYLKQWAV